MPETTDPQTPETSSPEPEGNDAAAAEAAYWKKMGDTIEQTVTNVVDKKLKDLFKGREGSRSEKGRTTIPGLLADFMYGPTKQR